MKKLLGLLVTSLALSATTSANAETKIGYIDMQKAIQDTSAGKKAKKDLEEDYNKKKKEIEKREADIKKMNEDLEKKAMVLSDDVKAKKQQDIQSEMLKFREMVGKSQMEIQKREQELTKPIIEGLRKIMAEIAEKEGYSMILEKSEQSVLWAKKDTDLTARLIEEFEKTKKK